MLLVGRERKTNNKTCRENTIITMPVLSRMLDYREEHGQDSDALKRASPIAWQHINLYRLNDIWVCSSKFKRPKLR